MRKYIITVLLFGVLSFVFIAMYKTEMQPVESLMRPPVYENAQGGLGKILNETIGEDSVLKSVAYNDSKSAIIYEDIDGDTTKEAIVFAQNDSEAGQVTMYLFEKKDDEWFLFDKTDNTAFDLQKLEIADMNSDGVCEIIIGFFSRPDNTGKMLKIFSSDKASNKLNMLFQSEYTVFNCIDINLDGRKDVFTISPNDVNFNTFDASFLVYDDIIKKVGSVKVNTMVSSVLSVNYDNFGNSLRVFIDGVSSDGLLITEVLQWKKELKILEHIMFNNDSICQLSKRESNISSTDVNGDGLLEIPFQISADKDSVPVINWVFLSGNEITTVGYMLDNSNQGFYFKLPQLWLDSITTIITDNGASLKFYALNSNKEIDISRPILEIKTTDSSSRNPTTKSYKLLNKGLNHTYYYKLFDDALIFNVNEKTLQDNMIFELKGCFE
ncbi:MAG: hypothetical protein IJ262_04970 [Clostridia bacterium]|nr:hypothetical protein [Clostridia bacterium]